MILLPMQFDRHSGPDAVGQHKITFTIDESIRMEQFNPMNVKKGTQYLVALIDLDVDEGHTEEKIKKTVEERLMSKLFAKMTDLSALTDTKAEDIKENLKTEMSIKSLTELDFRGLAKAITIIDEKINDN